MNARTSRMMVILVVMLILAANVIACGGDGNDTNPANNDLVEVGEDVEATKSHVKDAAFDLMVTTCKATNILSKMEQASCVVTETNCDASKAADAIGIDATELETYLSQ